ncbi:hypothetical protein Chor_001469 [Crotalus horridus]
MLRTEKVLLLRSLQGRSVRVVREHYLRPYVPCGSALCRAGCPRDGKLLSDDVTHYVVPDWKVLQDYLEILEFPELKGLINVNADSPRSIYNAAVWYYNHFSGQMPIVMVTEDEEAIQLFGSETEGVFVISFKNYLDNFWPDLKATHELLDSILQSRRERENESHENSGKEYPEHLPTEALEAGIKSGLYIQILDLLIHFLLPWYPDLKTDVLIYGTKARNRAIHGDVVAVELLPQREWKGRTAALGENESEEKASGEVYCEPMPTGKVVGILQKNWREYVVTFPSREENHSHGKNAQKVLVTPWDYRIPKIRISTQQAEALQDFRVVVRIDSWESSSLYPNGHFVRVVGRIGDLEGEIQTILVENTISVSPFSEAQMCEMPTLLPEKPWEVTPEEQQKRLDLRETHLVFSIDPKDCEDVDDALSIRLLPNGNLELGVHIADVTHFVAANSYTDMEAKARATTYYLADRRYDMLPAILSANLCSLLGNMDRYAVSVIWELDKTSYEIKRVRYKRTIIRSSYKLFYEAAQALLEGDLTAAAEIPELKSMEENARKQKLEELIWAIGKLTDVARHLRAKRSSYGALELEGIEIRVQLDDKKNINDLIPRQPLEVHETIAECMILANHWVAKKIWQALADSLDRAVDPSDPLVNQLLRSMVTQAMSNAVYFSTGSCPEEDFFHYGLALDKYTHFTSPIRRYADIIVHRLLLAATSTEEELGIKDCLLGNKELEELCRHINNRNRAAQHAQKQSTGLFQCMYFSDKSPAREEQCSADGVIYSIRTNGVLVFVPRYGIKGAAYLRNKEGLVISYPTGGDCKWQPGSLQRFPTKIIASPTAGEPVTLNLFDHVTTFRCHADRIQLQITSCKPYKTSEMEPSQRSQMSKTDLIREVTKTAEETQLAQNLAKENQAKEEFDEEYRQTQCRSLYHLLEEIKDLSLLDVSVNRGA